MTSFLRARGAYSVNLSSLHGDGVFAVHAVEVEEEQALWEEIPNLFLQSLENRSDALICANCHGFVGTLGTQVDVLQKKVSRQDIDQLALRATRSEGPEDERLSNSIIFCDQECGEMYCSQECAKAHWDRSHCLLCTGSMVEDEPLVQFKVQAVQTNEIFLMAADHFAEICTHVDAALSHMEDMDQRRQNAEGAAREATRPYASFVRNLWWDVAVPERGEDGEKLVESLKEMVHESWSYLNTALMLEARGLSEYLSEEYLSRTIGMFEQNNVGVRLRSPLAEKVDALYPGGDTVKIWSEAVTGIAAVLPPPEEELYSTEIHEYAYHGDGREGGEKEETEMDGDSGDPAYDAIFHTFETYDDTVILPPVDGAAFYLNICKINHSCEPNVRVEYKHGSETDLKVRGGAKKLTAYVKALRPIAQGEELLQAYVDEHLPYEERVRALAEYGFTCSCGKCQRGD